MNSVNKNYETIYCEKFNFSRRNKAEIICTQL